MDEKTKSHLHESPRVMTVPLIILAVLSIAGGWIGLPHLFGITNYFEVWLSPVMAKSGGAAGLHEPMLNSASGNEGTELLLMFATIALVGVAIIIAYRIYRRKPETADKLATKFSGAHKLLANKYYIDELYGAIIVRPTVYLSVFLWKVMDVLMIDGLINGMAKFYESISEELRAGQTGRIRSYATIFTIGVVLLVALVVML